MIIRPARDPDAQGMSEILAEIISHWQSARPSNIGYVLEHYANHEDQLATTVAKITFIDATISQGNPNGLAYYAVMGFSDYSDQAKTISKILIVPASLPKSYRGERFAKILCNVRRCMFNRRAVSDTLRSQSS